MCKRMIIMATFTLLVVLSGAVHADLVHHWTLDEDTTAGATTVKDSVGGLDGTIDGASSAEGVYGNSLYFDGAGTVEIAGFSTEGLKSMTMTFWMNPDVGYTSTGGFKRVISANDGWEVILQPNSGVVGNNLFRTGGTYAQSTVAPPEGEWTHVAVTADLAPPGTGLMEIYLNGEFDVSMEDQVVNDWGGGTFLLGYRASGGGEHYEGYLDDVRIYNTVLSAEEVEASLGGVSPALALVSSPEDLALDVERDATLIWTPGIFAGTHNVFLGTSLEDVNAASLADPLGTEVASGLDVNSFDPARMEFGTTYFWRVDEVNGTPDKTVYKGGVWSFETELYSNLIPGSEISVTASSVPANGLSGPEASIDGSGLDGDVHGTTTEDMWFTANPDLDPWIQYQFDEIKKLDTMKVWNSNSLAESSIGWGVKAIEIVYSEDGENWTVLDGTAELSRAPGGPGYDQFDVVAFNGAAAKYVRLNIGTNWGGLLQAYSISEVQFSAIPTRARTPVPDAGSVDVPLDTVATWRAGREAGQHKLYVGTDLNAVTGGTSASVTSNTNSYALSLLDLQLDETYYWRVDEINEVEAPSVWPGPVWNLSTPEALTVDDFEGYSNVSPNRPFQTWLDGFGYSADDFFPVGYDGNGSGAGVGHDIWSLSSPNYDGSIMEENTTIAGSSQSLPLYYTNGGVTERKWAVPQDWTVGGAKTMVLYFYGATENTGQLYVQINNGTQVLYDGSASALSTPYWTQWNIDLASLGDLQSVTQMSIGVQGGSGLVYIDDIRLYKEAPATGGEQIWIEAESASITAPLQVYSDKADASAGSYIGTDDLGNTGDQSDGIASFTFTVQGGTYKVNALVIAADAGDSFWIRLQGATMNTTPPEANNGWIRYNGIPHGDAWHWDDIHNDQDGSIPVEFTLPAGTHTLEIAYREDGALLDAIVITDQL